MISGVIISPYLLKIIFHLRQFEVYESIITFKITTLRNTFHYVWIIKYNQIKNICSLIFPISCRFVDNLEKKVVS